MSLIKRIEIAGLRGIYAPLELSFESNGVQSMVILARNGHGKSSITDAWEWFYSGNIERLNREDAKERCFPHVRSADEKSSSYISVHRVTGDELRQSFDHKRVTKPKLDGDVDGFRKAVPHPCHLRYEDLSRFVYKTKSEQYEALSKLMGFGSQHAFQVSLNKSYRLFEESCTKQKAITGSHVDGLKDLLGGADASEASVISILQEVLLRQGIAEAQSMAEIRKAVPVLEQRVKEDPRALEIADLNTIKEAVNGIKHPVSVDKDLGSFADSIEAFKLREQEAIDLLLIDLYEQGAKVIEEWISRELKSDTCPLCGRVYEGDLLEHINTELERLNELKKDRDSLEANRKRLLTLLTSIEPSIKILDKTIVARQDVSDRFEVGKILESARDLEEAIKTAQSLLGLKCEQVPGDVGVSVRAVADQLSSNTNSLKDLRTALIVVIDARLEELKDDAHRTQLVADSTHLSKVIEQWDKLTSERVKLARLEGTLGDFSVIVSDFVATSNADVQARFNTISANVGKFFSILEVDATNLSNPSLKLLTDHERAVTLEIEFLGNPISSAYKYLSESQLNSFGLALFLASAKEFNGAFKFLLLDDIVNSFDGYKRPQLIQLLRTELDDFQFLIMTHDDVWADQLFEAFQHWVRMKFVAFDATSGPTRMAGLSTLEKIEKNLDEDEADAAGRELGRLLEREFQELCELCEAQVKYTKRNEHTLKPLLDCLRARLKEKLKADHELVVSLNEFETLFRNYCTHWKNPPIPYTTAEIRKVVNHWKQIAAKMKCVEKKCSRYVKYDGNSSFKCSCGKVQVLKS